MLLIGFVCKWVASIGLRLVNSQSTNGWVCPLSVYLPDLSNVVYSKKSLPPWALVKLILFGWPGLAQATNEIVTGFLLQAQPSVCEVSLCQSSRAASALRCLPECLLYIYFALGVCCTFFSLNVWCMFSCSHIWSEADGLDLRLHVFKSFASWNYVTKRSLAIGEYYWTWTWLQNYSHWFSHIRLA